MAAEDTDSSLLPPVNSRKRSDTDLGLGTFNLFFGPDTAATNTYTHICSLSIFSFLSSFITTNQLFEFSLSGVQYDNPERTATISTAVFNLVSTIVGGGVLSLPFAISVQGVFGGLIAILLSALASEFSIYILIASSRRRGARGYEDVAAAALGEKARIIPVVLIFSLTFLVAIAYVILMADLVSALVDLASRHQILEAVSREYVILISVVCVSPLAFFRKMDALRFTSILSVISVFGLGLVTAYKLIYSGILVPIPWKNETGDTPAPTSAYASASGFDAFSHNYNRTLPLGEILWWPASIEDYIYTLPIESVAFLCHFNVLPMQDELIRPTRRRVRKVTHSTIVVCLGLYTGIAMTGYFRFTSSTCGDYLNNFLNDDPIATAARIGMVLTLYCSFPLLVLPCRATFSRLMDLLCCPSNTATTTTTTTTTNDNNREENGKVNTTEQLENPIINHKTSLDALLSPMGSFISDSPHVNQQQRTEQRRAERRINSAGYGSIKDEHEDPIVENDIDTSNVTKDDNKRSEISTTRHVTLTLIMLVSVLFLALKIESVVTIWSIAGSSVAMLIAYIMPSLFYIKLRKGIPCNVRIVAAYVLLCCSTILFFLCGWQAIVQLDRPNCPERGH